MKILHIAPLSSIHVIRWCNALAKKGIDLHIASMHEIKEKLDDRIITYKLPIKAPMGYLLNFLWLKWIVRKTSPDLIHIHQASGHGTLSRISNLHPVLLSVYGADVYDFPLKSKIHKTLIKRNLEHADYIGSTSNTMKKHVELLFPNLNKYIHVTPFGVNTKIFKPQEVSLERKEVIIGIVKRLEEKYGIKYLIVAFKYLIDYLINIGKKDLSNSLKLIIVGEGSQKEELMKKSNELKITNKVQFPGRISHKEIPDWLNMFDIYCAPSIYESESFGVAVIEASACGLPVVVSNIGGLPEVVDDKITGFLVSPKDPSEIAQKLMHLIFNPNLREKMGEAGRGKVIKLYDWDENVNHMVNIYQQIIYEKK